MMKKSVSILLCMVMVVPILSVSRPSRTDAADSAGPAVAFDGNGSFADMLDNLDHMFDHSGIVRAGGSITGPGEAVYYAGDDSFGAIAIEATFNKWSLNYVAASDLKVYEADYDADTGTWTNGNQVEMIRKLRPGSMSSKDIDKAVYISGNIAAGTKYLRVVLPEADYFADNGKYGDFQIDGIALTSEAAATDELEYVVDNASDFAQLADGTDTNNLRIFDMTTPDRIWDARTFASLHYIYRQDATLEDRAMTYAAPGGKEFKTVYVEGYYNFAPSKEFEVWASEDGVEYANVTQSSHYSRSTISYEGNWLPTILEIGSLPAGTTYIQVRFPAFTTGELYGIKHPYMTKAALGYGEPGDSGGPGDPGDPGDGYPDRTTIKFVSSQVNIDGVVVPDAAGEWENAQAAVIEGITEGGNEHGAQIYLQYDYDNVYVGAKIKDPTPMVNSSTGMNIWNGDNLEIFLGTEDLDFTLYPDQTNTMIGSDVQIVLSGSTVHGPQYYIYANGEFTYPNLQLNVQPDADGKGYTIEASIPWNLLGVANPWEGKPIIMNAVLNNGAYAGRGQWGWTTNGEGSKKSRGLWGLATFEAAPEPPAEITVEASVESDTNLVAIAGQTLHVQGQDVTLLVTDAEGTIAHIDQAPSDGEGNYAFTFRIHGGVFESGQYTATVGGTGVDRVNSTVFAYTPREIEFDPTPPDDGTTPPAADPPGNPSDNEPIFHADLSGIEPDRNNHFVVDMPESATAVRLPADQIALVGDGFLVVKSGDVRLLVSRELLEQAAALGDSKETAGTGVDVLVERLDDGDPSAAPEYPGTSTLQVTAVGNSYRIGIALTRGDGTTYELDWFDHPAAIALAYDDSEADEELLGVYYFNEQTKMWEYAGGQASGDGEITAQLLVPGTYRVLEYKKSFTDLPAAHWASRAVEVLAAKHIVNGVSDVRFNPGQSTARGDFAVMLAKALGLGAASGTSFDDVDPTRYYAGAIEALYEVKLINGRGNRMFGPEGNITREEMLVLIVRAFEYTTGAALQAGGGEPFADDANMSGWARDAVQAAKNAGLVNGKGNNRFDPGADSTRSETAQIIYNFLHDLRENR